MTSRRTTLCMFVLAAAAAAQDPPVGPPPGQQPSPAQAAATRIEQQLGLKFAVATSKIRRRMIRTDTPWGFAIRSVAEGSLAAKGGLERGTIVLAVDGKPLRELEELAEVLRSKKPGEVVKLACARRKRPAKLLDRHPWEDVVVEIRLPERDGDSGKEKK